MAVIKFPDREEIQTPNEPMEDDIGVKEILASFTSSQDKFEEVLCIGITPDGRISWGSSSDDLRSVLWTLKAMERITMDLSLGLVPDDDY